MFERCTERKGCFIVQHWDHPKYIMLSPETKHNSFWLLHIKMLLLVCEKIRLRNLFCSHILYAPDTHFLIRKYFQLCYKRVCFYMVGLSSTTAKSPPCESQLLLVWYVFCFFLNCFLLLSKVLVINLTILQQNTMIISLKKNSEFNMISHNMAINYITLH